MKDKLLILKYLVSKRYFSSFKSRKALEKYQNKRIKKHLSFLSKKSEYFSRFIKKDTALCEIPFMDKTVMMENFNSMNTVGIDRDTALEMAIDAEKTRDFSKQYGGITVGLSSGTSGNRGMFIVSPFDRCAWAGSVVGKLLPSDNMFGHRVALFLRANSEMYESIDSKLIKFRYFDILLPIEDHIDNLNRYAPTILAAPPSVLLPLSDMILSGKINFRPVKVISIAEVLEKTDADRIKAAFGVPFVHQIYQCTEGFLGYTCECGGFHLNEDMVYIEKEYIDRSSGRFIPVITDFTRRAQPIVRYRLNDILIEDTSPCKCGSSLMKISYIEGRADDVFYFPSAKGEGSVTVYSDFIRRCVLFSGVGKEYRVVQISEGLVQLQLLYGEDITPFTNELEKLAREMGFVMPRVESAPFETEKGKKLKRVECRLKKHSAV